MSQGKSLLQAILDDPDDVPRRLIYADWLEEQDDPIGRLHAEYIRIEHRLDHLPDDHPAAASLGQRHAELWEKHNQAWFGELFHLVESLDETWCGFPDAITVSTKDFLRNAEAIFALAPVREVLFQDQGRKHLSALAACPHLQHVRRISFGDGTYGDAITHAGARTLAASPYLCNLEVLDLFECHVGPSGMEALASSPHLSKLRKLLVQENDVRDRGALAIAGAQSWDGLEVLDLLSCNVQLGGLVALCGAPHLRDLHELGLQGNPLGQYGGSVLSNAPWRQLRSLDLSQTGLTVEGVERLSNSTVVNPLRKLRLCWNHLGSEGMAALLRPTRLEHLETLDLTEVDLDAAAMRTLIERWPFANLRELRLDNNRLGDEGVAILARGPGLRTLRDLRLCEVRLTDQGVKELAESPHLAGLRTLWLHDEALTDSAVESLVASPYLGESARVWLTSPRVSEAAKQRLHNRFRG